MPDTLHSLHSQGSNLLPPPLLRFIVPALAGTNHAHSHFGGSAHPCTFAHPFKGVFFYLVYLNQ